MVDKFTKFACNKNITIILTILLFLMPTFMLPYDLTSFKTIAFARATIFISCGFILLLMLIIRKEEIKFDMVDKILLIFYIIGWISTFFAINPLRAIIGDISRYDGMIIITFYLIVYYCAKNFCIYYKDLFKAVIYMAVLLCFIVILQSYELLPIGNHIVIPYVPLCPAATLMNSNIFGSYITLFTPIIICIYLFKNNKLFLLFSVIAFIATVVCFVRSAWIALLISLFTIFIYLIFKKDKQLWKRAGILFVCFILALGFVYFTKSGSLSYRVNTLVTESKSIANAEINDDMGSRKNIIMENGIKRYN